MKTRVKIKNNIGAVVALAKIIKPRIAFPARSLFYNSIKQGDIFGISSNFSDRYNSLTKEITPEVAKTNFEINGRCFKGKDDRVRLMINKKIGNAEQFYEELEKIKKGKILQTLLAIWSYAKKQNSFIFKNVRLTEIMKLILKPNKFGYFSQAQKEEFTNAIHTLRSFEIYLDNRVIDKDKNGRKKRVIKRSYFKLIDLVSAIYARRRNGTTDDSVIVKLNGELLPRFNKGIMRGRLYGNGLLELDANKDENALVLGFKLFTRFDQLRQGKLGKYSNVDSRLYIDTDREKLVEWAGYKQTDKANKAVASRRLEKILSKLIRAKCLKGYTPRRITVNDNLRIRLYAYPLTPKGITN